MSTVEANFLPRSRFPVDIARHRPATPLRAWDHARRLDARNTVGLWL